MWAALITAFVLAFDLLTKYIIKTSMSIGDTIPVIKDVIHITYAENKGAAFSILKDQRWVFMVISTLAIIAIIVCLAAFKKHLNRLTTISLSMILGGAIGNMIDRIFNGEVLFDGGVVDFIDFRIIDFAIFNIADSFVCIGACLMVLGVILDEIAEKKASKSGNGIEKGAQASCDAGEDTNE